MTKILNLAIVFACTLLLLVSTHTEQKTPEYSIASIGLSNNLRYARINYEVDLHHTGSRTVSNAEFQKLASSSPVFLNDKDLCRSKWFGLYQTYELTYFLISDDTLYTTKVDLRDQFHSKHRGYKCTVWHDKIYVFVSK